MAQPTPADVKDFINSTLDPDTLRVIQHKCDERLEMLRGKRDIHVRPQVDLTGKANTTPPDSVPTPKASEKPAAHK